MATINENGNDAAADSGTQYTIALGDVFKGALDSAHDEDVVRVELDAETIYDISQTGGKNARLSIFDSQGNPFIDGFSRPAGAKVIFSPDKSGTYYIGIFNNNNEATGEYEISLSENTTPIGTYDDLADFLTETSWFEEINGPRPVFDVTSSNELTVNITGLGETGQHLARWAFDAWASVADLKFRFTDDENAQILVRSVSGPNARNQAKGRTLEGGDAGSYINIVESGFPQSDATINNVMFFVLVHEIGHALGLTHTGPYDGAITYGDDIAYLVDSLQASVMSYIDQNMNTYINASLARPATTMIADIIAIQKFYGAPDDTNSGDTVYGYQSNVDGYLGEFFGLWTGGSNPFIHVEAPDDPVVAYHTQALADLDGDGAPDMVIGNHQGDFHYFENTGTDGNPEFSLRTGESNPLDSLVANFDSTPVFADLDGDGDLDLVNGHNDGTVSYIENTGTVTSPDFVQRSGADNPFDGIDTGDNSTPALADLDGDGDLDLIAGNRDGGLTWFENTGTASAPAFTQRTGTDNPLDGISMNANSAPELADLDDDGDFDLVLWGWYGAIDYYENTGTAANPVFEARSDAGDPLGGINFANLGKPSLADLDGDGDLDLVVRDSRGTDFQYLKNDGTAAAPEFIRPQLRHPAALTLYDTGGADTLDLRTDQEDQRIDLRPEGISDVYGLIGNLVIARDVVIEDAIAGFGNDLIIGNEAANRLEGRAGDDVLEGGAGDDVLEGGAGADTLDGGEGIDTVSYSGSNAGVTVRLLTGEGLRGDAEGDTLTHIENLIGSQYNDAFGGDLGNNVLRGGPGNDGLWGSGGDDTLIGGPGADRFYGGHGQDTADYTDSPAGVTVRLHSLMAAGGDATGDTFPGRVDVAYTDADGVEQTESLPDVENLAGSAHNDVLAGDRRDNVLDGGAGDDTLYGGPGGGDDAMLGSAGNDRLFGGQGSDRLDGGAGDDRLAGGPGADVFVFAPRHGADTITDFTDTEDQIDLTSFALSGYDDLTLTSGTDGVTIDLSAHDGGTILLEGFTAANLDAADFLF